MLYGPTHGFYGWRAGLAGAASAGSATRGTWADLLRGHIGVLPTTHDLSDALDQAHPFYWAAFIPAGDWRPLDATAFLPHRSTP